jgi:hypothetical protein
MEGVSEVFSILGFEVRGWVRFFFFKMSSFQNTRQNRTGTCSFGFLLWSLSLVHASHTTAYPMAKYAGLRKSSTSSTHPPSPSLPFPPLLQQRKGKGRAAAAL